MISWSLLASASQPAPASGSGKMQIEKAVIGRGG